MKGRVILLDTVSGRPAAALMVDGVLEDLLVDPHEHAPAPGEIHRVIVDRQVKGQGGVFVRMADGHRGFLRQTKGVAPGDRLVVQVTGYAEPGKAPPVTLNAIFKSRYCIVTPGKPGLNIARSIRDEALRDRLLELAHDAAAGTEHGLILRSAAGLEPVAEADISDDIAAMVALADAVASDCEIATPELLVDAPTAHLAAWRDWTNPRPDEVITEARCFETHGVFDAMARLGAGAWPLPGGGSFYVEQTRALTAVDVNTGSDTSPAAALKANLDVCRALPRALRIRGIGGAITIDFAPLAKRDRKQVEHLLKTIFRMDPVDTVLVGWTPLGHFELQRKRERAVIDACTFAD